MSSSDRLNESSLVDAYNQMMIRIRDSIYNVEAHAVPSLQTAIDQARQQAIDLGEITLEEAEEVGNYIKRDINEAAEYLMETSHEFSEWMKLDIETIEQKLLALFFSVADNTRLELARLAQPRPRLEYSSYHSGDITGPGTLICNQCGDVIRFNTPGKIPVCRKCQGNQFVRAEKQTR